VRALYCLPEGFCSAGFSSAGFSPVVWVFSSGFIMVPALSELAGFSAGAGVEVMLGSDGLAGLSEDIPVPDGLEGLEGLMGAIPPPEGLEGLIEPPPPLEGAVVLPLPLGSTGAPVLGVPELGFP
jgi:hypothetical protein